MRLDRLMPMMLLIRLIPLTLLMRLILVILPILPSLGKAAVAIALYLQWLLHSGGARGWHRGENLLRWQDLHKRRLERVRPGLQKTGKAARKQVFQKVWVRVISLTENSAIFLRNLTNTHFPLTFRPRVGGDFIFCLSSSLWRGRIARIVILIVKSIGGVKKNQQGFTGA